MNDLTKELLIIMLSAVVIDNFVLSQFLGICPFLGVSKKISSSIGMGLAVIFVMTLSAAVTYPVYKLLVKLEVPYLKTIAFILLIALLVQLVEIIVKKKMPALYNALGVYLPLITTNCAVLGVTLMNIDFEFDKFGYLKSIVNAAFAGIGFTLALLLFAGVRSRMDGADIPKMFKGMPSVLIAASIMSLSFMGFSGIA